LNKRLSLAAALGATKLITINDMNLKPVCCTKAHAMLQL